MLTGREQFWHFRMIFTDYSVMPSLFFMWKATGNLLLRESYGWLQLFWGFGGHDAVP